jgi:hypothetical protein
MDEFRSLVVQKTPESLTNKGFFPKQRFSSLKAIEAILNVFPWFESTQFRLFGLSTTTNIL